MSIKCDIEKLYQDNIDYKTPRQALNQASSLDSLSKDLYTDSKRFIYELLQNADDSSEDGDGIKVYIKIVENYLVIAHSGKIFSSRDVQALCNVNNGTKKGDLNKTGYKGIGFKSVFGQSDQVIVFTNKEYFKFDREYNFEWRWEDNKTKWETIEKEKFQFPWQIIPIYINQDEVLSPIKTYLNSIDAKVATIIRIENIKNIEESLRSLLNNINMFLFIKNINEINFDIPNGKVIEIERSIKNKILLKENGKEKIEWLIKTEKLKVPKELKEHLQLDQNIPQKLKATDYIEISFAAKIDNGKLCSILSNENSIYSYLPTDEVKYNLPILVNTSFLTTANRETIHVDSEWNQWIFKEMSLMLFKWISELIEAENFVEAYELIPKKIDINNKLGEYFNIGIEKALKEVSFLMSLDGKIIKAEDAVLDLTYLSKINILDEISIQKFLEKEKGCTKKFIKHFGYLKEISNLGVEIFSWNDFNNFFKSKYFRQDYNINKNIELVQFFYNLSKDNKIGKEQLKELLFLYDHRNEIKAPRKICFPSPEDDKWNDDKNELSFIHIDLQKWLFKNIEKRRWLESLGVEEKTDITYVTQIIIPQIESYVTVENAIKVLNELFNLYQKEILSRELIKKLSKIKLLTQNGELLEAEKCYLSDYYNPRVKLEKNICDKIFVNESYSSNLNEKEQWKEFFRQLGVQEGAERCLYIDKEKKEKLSTEGININ